MTNTPRPHVLLVDDDELLLHAIVRALRPTRRPVLIAATAAAATAQLAGHEVGVIVCDPYDTRLAEFLIDVRERLPSVVRVILTGYPDMVSVLKTVNDASPFKLLTKPWLDAELLATVKLAFEQYAVNRKRDRLIGDYASIRASAERSHASHVLDAMMSVPPDMKVGVVADLPVGVLLLMDGAVAQVNAAAQRFLAGLGLTVPEAGEAVSLQPAPLFAFIAAALATPRRQRRSHPVAEGGRLDYFILDLAAGTLIVFAPAPKAGQLQF